MALQRSNGLLEVEYFPKSNCEIQHADAGYRAPHPTRRDNCL